MPLDLEEVLLFLDGLRLDHGRRQALTDGSQLRYEAVRAGLIPDLGQHWEFTHLMIEARQIGWVTWTAASFDHWGTDLPNGHDFRLTDAGLRSARELKGFPRFLLTAQG